MYTGSTEKKAVDAIVAWVGTSRFHTRRPRPAYTPRLVVPTHSGFHTAYIGSSNLTHSALVEGVEWNVRVSEVDNPAIVERVGADV